jgi:poly-gamma-glutamate synthesis protein (capsule biosynthesis protein)
MVAQGAEWPFIKIKPVLERADFLFGNMESVAIPADFPQEKLSKSGLISGVSGAMAAQALKWAGFEIMNMAANHVLDAGTVGLLHTRHTLRDAGIAVGGVGATQEEARALQVIEKKGLKIGFLCYCEQNNCTLQTNGLTHAYYETETVVEDVRANRDKVDVLVVSLHADIEFTPAPAVPRQISARKIAEAGAAVILQHHPHVPQGIEWHEGCLIAYSLGNFVFPAHTSTYMKSNGPHTAHSMVLLIELDSKGVCSFERVPVVIGEPPDERPQPAEGAKGEELATYFAELDRILTDPQMVSQIWRQTVRKYLNDYAGYILRQDEDAATIILEDVLPRFIYVAENRNVMNEAVAMARENWEKVLKQNTTWQRPEM